MRRDRRTAIAALLGSLTVAFLAAHRWFARGPRSFRREYERLAADGVAVRVSGDVVTEDDLRSLPDPVAGYLRATGAIGAPRPANVHAVIHGRIRSAPDSPWMSFSGEQFNTFGDPSSRLFLITASMRGLPADVFHRFVGADATMRARALSVIPVLDARGPEMNRSETVTILNDMCVFAPAALLDADIEWTSIDERSARATFTRLDETVSAVLVFDERDLLVDFVSDDRCRSSADGTTFTQERWSTPLAHGRTPDGRWTCTYGEAHWHPTDGEFCYLEIWIDDVRCDVEAVGPVSRPRAGRPRTRASRSGR
jgi:hypothetical protein